MFEVFLIVSGRNDDCVLVRDVHGSDTQIRFVPVNLIDYSMQPMRYLSYRRACKVAQDIAPRGTAIDIRHVAAPKAQRRDMLTGRLAGSTKQIGR